MGYKPKRDVPPMERELDYLLYDLCVKWGFCIPAEDSDRISKAKYYMADEFAQDVLTAEGMNPGEERTWMRKITNIFTERFGTNEIDEDTFVDRVRGIKESWQNA
ncbi:hypothetical protein BKI52_40660 [marine bacterium AO1-C]|nr:hypothetical protein BKI52_40660 [marine bacterium AO1-C]